MEYLVIGPGAMGGFSMLGYLKTIEPSLVNIKEYSGASAGAILILFLALGFNIDQILHKLAELEGNKLVKLNLKCFMNKYGLVDLKPIREKFVELFESDLTFSDIDKKIYISAFCVNTSKTVYFSKDTHPDMKVIDALCMSIAIPFIFSSYRYDGMVYVDGGTLETLPTTPFLDKRPGKVLCIRMKMETEFIEDIKSPKQFAEALISSTLNNRQTCELKNSKVVDIDIGQVDVFNFNMSYEEKMKLYLTGLESK
jgi:predicted acylesterase/phospholipase RssA